MRATVVIGANWGDEGKGLMTDYLCANSGDCSGGPIVVRFNGGAQAGHTVVTNRRRHVFHHFGSGAFAGAATFLSRYFVVNPFLWAKERDELGFCPEVFVDRAALLTTPYDMLVNQEAERIRGGGRHGSCGVGFNETIERNLRGEFGTRVADIADRAALRRTLERIRRDYAPARLRELVRCDGSDDFRRLLASDPLLESFLDAADAFRAASTLCDASVLRSRRHIVFEGAQGLLLDEHHRFFPHVTRSKTGLCNAVAICREIGIESLAAVYMTRAYMTRHGAGPFPTEDARLAYPDPTNAPNEFQGLLRFGRLDHALLAESIAADLASVSGVTVDAAIAVTCLDQVGGDIDAMSAAIGEHTAVPVRYASFGPKRSDVREMAMVKSLR